MNKAIVNNIEEIGVAGRHENQVASDANESQTASFRRVVSIAHNTFREAVRDRVLYNLVLFVLLLSACAVFIGELSTAQESKVIVDLGLSASLLFGAFIAIFVGTGLVYKEIERRTLYAMLAKPVRRGEFIVGKYLGLCLTLLVNVAVMGLGIALALVYAGGGWNGLIAAIVPALALVYVELIILVAVALLFSTFSTPALAAMLTFGVFIIGNFSSDLRTFAASLGSSGARLFFAALYYVLPNLSLYSWSAAAGHGHTPHALEFVGALLYGILYAIALLALATLIFNRRNFK